MPPGGALAITQGRTLASVAFSSSLNSMEEERTIPERFRGLIEDAVRLVCDGSPAVLASNDRISCRGDDPLPWIREAGVELVPLVPRLGSRRMQDLSVVSQGSGGWWSIFGTRGVGRTTALKPRFAKRLTDTCLPSTTSTSCSGRRGGVWERVCAIDQILARKRSRGGTDWVIAAAIRSPGTSGAHPDSAPLFRLRLPWSVRGGHWPPGLRNDREGVRWVVTGCDAGTEATPRV